MQILIDENGRTYAILSTGERISQYQAEEINRKEKGIPEEFFNYGSPETGR